MMPSRQNRKQSRPHILERQSLEQVPMKKVFVRTRTHEKGFRKAPYYGAGRMPSGGNRIPSSNEAPSDMQHSI